MLHLGDGFQTIVWNTSGLTLWSFRQNKSLQHLDEKSQTNINALKYMHTHALKTV